MLGLENHAATLSRNGEADRVAPRTILLNPYDLRMFLQWILQAAWIRPDLIDFVGRGEAI